MREWDSPTPDTLIIRDECELERGDGVEFYWQTQLSCRQEGRAVTITGETGAATLTVPDGASVRLETLPLYGGDAHQRIAIRNEGASGSLEVRVTLAPGVSGGNEKE